MITIAWLNTSRNPIVSANAYLAISMRPYPSSLSVVSMGLFIVIVLAPLGLMLFRSLWSQGLSLSAYGSLADPRHLTLAANSLITATGATLAAVLIGTCQALLIERVDTRWRRFFGLVHFLPLLIPPYVHAIVWAFCLGPTGMINRRLATLMPDLSQLISIYSIGGVIYIFTIAYTPLVTLCVISGLKSLDARLEDAGLLTSNPMTVMRRISLPLLKPHILCGGLLVFVLTIVNFEVPDLMRVRVYPTEIFIQFSAFYNAGTATALSLPLIVLTFAGLVVVRRFMQNRPYVAITGDMQIAAPRYPVSSTWRLVCLFMGLWFCVSTVAPVGVLLVKALPWRSFAEVLRTSSDEILYSCILAGCGAALLTASSLGWAYLVERGRTWHTILDIVTLLPFAVPGTVLGIGLILLWNRPWSQWIYGGSLIVLIAYLAHFAPFTIRVMAANIKQVDYKLEEAAYLTASSWFTRMRKILLPLLRPGLFLCFFLGFVFCFGDLAATLLVIPPGHETVPIKIYNLLHYGAEQMVAALCLVVILIIFTAAVFLWAVYHRFGRLK